MYKPKVTTTYDRTEEDYIAEKLSEQAAIKGEWSDFVNEPTDDLDSPVNEIASEAQADQANKRLEFIEALASNGWPDGMIKHAVEIHFPTETVR